MKLLNILTLTPNLLNFLNGIVHIPFIDTVHFFDTVRYYFQQGYQDEKLKLVSQQ